MQFYVVDAHTFIEASPAPTVFFALLLEFHPYAAYRTRQYLPRAMGAR
jgi:hypothetical protein